MPAFWPARRAGASDEKGRLGSIGTNRVPGIRSPPGALIFAVASNPDRGRPPIRTARSPHPYPARPRFRCPETPDASRCPEADMPRPLLALLGLVAVLLAAPRVSAADPPADLAVVPGDAAGFLAVDVPAFLDS